MEYLVDGVGTAPGTYATLQSAINQVNTDGPFNFNNPARILITATSITLSAGVTIPVGTHVIAQGRVRVHTTMASGDCITLSGFNRIYGLEYVGGHASNTDFFIQAGDTTDNSIIECHLYGNDVDGFMKFLSASGANWKRINVERCIINYRGTGGYAFEFWNSGSTRFVDTWINDCFIDAFADFLAAGKYGGCINVMGGCEDLRIKRSTIRGWNQNYTGLRVSGANAEVTLVHNNFDSQGMSNQTGFDIYSVPGSQVIDSYSTAKKVLFEGARTRRYRI